jgi:hypothetical protein
LRHFHPSVTAQTATAYEMGSLLACRKALPAGTPIAWAMLARAGQPDRNPGVAVKKHNKG